MVRAKVVTGLRCMQDEVNQKEESVLSCLHLLMTPPLPSRVVRFLNVRWLCSQQQIISGVQRGRYRSAPPSLWSPPFPWTHVRLMAKLNLSSTLDWRKYRLRVLRVS